MPATAIIGYPPAATARMPCRAGSRPAAARLARFKIPIALPLEYGRDRLLAAREAAGDDAWLGMDAAWVFRSVDDAVSFLDDVREARLAWFEDVFPPGDAEIVGRPARRTGRTRSPWATSRAEATTRRRCSCARPSTSCASTSRAWAGSPVRGRMIDACERAATAFAPHMFAHVHSQVFAGLGYDVPVEWGVPGTGVDQFADSLRRPVDLEDGLMEPLPVEPGFGPLVNAAWFASEDVDEGPGRAGALADELTLRLRQRRRSDERLRQDRRLGVVELLLAHQRSPRREGQRVSDRGVRAMACGAAQPAPSHERLARRFEVAVEAREPFPDYRDDQLVAKEVVEHALGLPVVRVELAEGRRQARVRRLDCRPASQLGAWVRGPPVRAARSKTAASSAKWR